MDKPAANKLTELQRVLLGVVFTTLWSTLFTVLFDKVFIGITD